MTDMTQAWDTHAHVIGDTTRYALSGGHTYEPPLATVDDYIAVLDRFAVQYGVLVQPSVYGFDHSCMLDALDNARARLFGIAVPAPDATPHELQRLHERGVRGVRCNLIQPGGLSPGVIVSWQPVLRELGWHVELQLHVDRVDNLPTFVTRFGVPVVIDHMGRPANASVAAAGALIDLVSDGACYVKLSAPYRMSASPAPWPDVAPLAHALLAASVQHCMWATDWPHTQFAPTIDENDVKEALRAWCPDDDARNIILRDTPVRLFGGHPTG